MKFWPKKTTEPMELDEISKPMQSEVLYEDDPYRGEPEDVYHHMVAWLEVLGTADYAKSAYLKEAQKKQAPIESVYELWEDDGEGGLKSAGWVQYKDLRSEHMTKEIEKIFEKNKWGTP